MRTDVYRFNFPTVLPLEEVEASLLLALWGAESLHGETQVMLDGSHAFDKDKRACVIDTSTPVGRSLYCLFVGFLRRQFGRDAFTVGRVTAPVETSAAA